MERCLDVVVGFEADLLLWVSSRESGWAFAVLVVEFDGLLHREDGGCIYGRMEVFTDRHDICEIMKLPLRKPP